MLFCKINLLFVRTVRNRCEAFSIWEPVLVLIRINYPRYVWKKHRTSRTTWYCKPINEFRSIIIDNAVSWNDKSVTDCREDFIGALGVVFREVSSLFNGIYLYKIGSLTRIIDIDMAFPIDEIYIGRVRQGETFNFCIIGRLFNLCQCWTTSDDDSSKEEQQFFHNKRADVSIFIGSTSWKHWL